MSKYKILAVDDQELNLLLVRKTLKDLDVEFVEATSGSYAIEILKKSPDFDLILMDVQMSGLSGFDTVKIIKEDERLTEIPVIFITAYYDQSEYIKQGYSLGAFDYIVKPFDKNTLIGKVRLYLSLQHEKKINRIQANQLKSINRSLNILNECNTALVYSEEENEILNAFCSILVEYGNYPLVMICRPEIQTAENSKVNSIVPLAFYNSTQIELDELNFSIGVPFKIESENELLISNKLEFVDCINNCNLCSLLKYSNKYNLIALKFGNAGVTEYVLLIFSEKDFVFNNSEQELISAVTTSMIYGVRALSDKFERKRYQSELLKEKEELITTLKGITDGVMFFQPNGKIMYFNDAASKILDIEPSELKNMLIFDIFKVVSDEGEELFNPVDIIQNDNNGEFFKFQINIRTNSNKKLILSGKMAKINNQLDFISGITLFFQDITEQVKLANELSLAQKMESVGRLASGIAHEINTPLQFIGDNNYFLSDAAESIIEYIKLIDEKISENINNESVKNIFAGISKSKEDLGIDFLTNEIKNAVNSNLDGIQRVSNIVLAMKNFAHPSGKQKILANINQSIETTSIISKNEWKYDSELTLDLDNQLPSIYCVIDEINQVLLNIIINSVHAIQEKNSKTDKLAKGEILIKTGYDDKWVYITVKDSGTGISKENLEKIFDPFFTTKPVGKGTGQGLPIVHDIIVNKHKGRLNVESELGHFTKFIISLPR